MNAAKKNSGLLLPAMNAAKKDSGLLITGNEGSQEGQWLINCRQLKQPRTAAY